MKKKIFIIPLTALLITLGSCGTEPGPIKHTIIFNSNGGSEVLSQTVVHGEKIKRPADPTKTGYEFNNWIYEGEKWSFIGYTCTEDMTLYANWNLSSYSITYELDGGTNDPSNPSFYTIESDSITLKDASKDNYQFIEWIDADNGTTITSIEKGSYGNLTVRAVYEGLPHTISVVSADTSKGSVSGGGTFKTGESVTVMAKSNPGYGFEGWYDGPTRVSQDATYTFICSKDLTLTAKWIFVIG